MILVAMNFIPNFACNNTCHASRKISATGQVFAFIGFGSLVPLTALPYEV